MDLRAVAMGGNGRRGNSACLFLNCVPTEFWLFANEKKKKKHQTAVNYMVEESSTLLTRVVTTTFKMTVRLCSSQTHATCAHRLAAEHLCPHRSKITVEESTEHPQSRKGGRDCMNELLSSLQQLCHTDQILPAFLGNPE